MTGARAVAAAAPSTVLRLTGAEPARLWAARLAEVTRAGYAGSDPVPGLPAPDGARETTGEVARALAGGATAWVALDPAGAPVTVLRVHDRGAAGWEITRVATVPAAKREGGARRLLAVVEAAAVGAGVRRIWLSAVVERCLPPYYARLGYRVADHWPSPDKLLSELTMERDPRRRAEPDPCPWWRHPQPDGSPVLCWLRTPTALLAVPVALDGPLPSVLGRVAATVADGALLAGVDLPSPAVPPLAELLAAAGGRPLGRGAPAWAFPSGPTPPAMYRQPRREHPGLLAYWRLRPGREIPPSTFPPGRSEDHG